MTASTTAAQPMPTAAKPKKRPPAVGYPCQRRPALLVVSPGLIPDHWPADFLLPHTLRHPDLRAGGRFFRTGNGSDGRRRFRCPKAWTATAS